MRTLYVSDLDGTLLNSDSKVSTASARLLNESMARGCMFTIATARTPATVIDLLSDVDMCLPSIVITGGAYYDWKQRRLTSPRFMTSELAKQISVDWRNSGLGGFLYTLDSEGILQVYHIGVLSDLERDFMSQRSNTPCKVFHVPEDGNSTIPSDLSRTMLFFGMQPTEPSERFYESLCNRYGESITPQFYHDIYGDSVAEFEVFPQNVTKASALERLASDLAIDRLIVFGDNVNDIPMMRIADEAVAVANAKDVVKEAATAVIECNDTDSVARFIRNEFR